MKTISLYENLATPIHQLDPLSKILYIITVLLLPLIGGDKNLTVFCILLSFIGLCVGRVIKKTFPILSFSFIVILTVGVIQGLFRAGNTTVCLEIGPFIFYKEGLRFALGIGLNVINLLLAFSILVLTTKPSDLIEALVKLGLSPKLGYVLSSVFQIIPQMSTTMETITDAQRSRGMETEGNLVTRLKAFFPLIGPVVMNSLVMTRERAIALEVRGFNSKKPKSFLNARQTTKGDWIFRLTLLLLLMGTLIGRLF